MITNSATYQQVILRTSGLMSMLKVLMFFYIGPSDFIKKNIRLVWYALSNLEFKKRGVSRVVEACINRLTRVSNVEPFAYEKE